MEWIPNHVVLSRRMCFDSGLGDDVLSRDRCNPVAKSTSYLSGNAKCDFVFVRNFWQDGGSSRRSSRWNGCEGTLLLSLLLLFVVIFCDFDVSNFGQARGGGGMAPGMGGMAGPLDEDNTVPFFVLTKQCLGHTR